MLGFPLQISVYGVPGWHNIGKFIKQNQNPTLRLNSRESDCCHCPLWYFEITTLQCWLWTTLSHCMLFVSCRFFCLLKLACLCSLSKTPLSSQALLICLFKSHILSYSGQAVVVQSHTKDFPACCLDHESFHGCRKLPHFNLSCTCWHFSCISSLT